MGLDETQSLWSEDDNAAMIRHLMDSPIPDNSSSCTAAQTFGHLFAAPSSRCRAFTPRQGIRQILPIESPKWPPRRYRHRSVLRRHCRGKTALRSCNQPTERCGTARWNQLGSGPQLASRPYQTPFPGRRPKIIPPTWRLKFSCPSRSARIFGPLGQFLKIEHFSHSGLRAWQIARP